MSLLPIPFENEISYTPLEFVDVPFDTPVESRPGFSKAEPQSRSEYIGNILDTPVKTNIKELLTPIKNLISLGTLATLHGQGVVFDSIMKLPAAFEMNSSELELIDEMFLKVDKEISGDNATPDQLKALALKTFGERITAEQLEDISADPERNGIFLRYMLSRRINNTPRYFKSESKTSRGLTQKEVNTRLVEGAFIDVANRTVLQLDKNPLLEANVV